MENLYKKYYLKLNSQIDTPTAEVLAQELAQKGETNVVIRRLDESHIALKLSKNKFITVVNLGGERLSYREYVNKTGRDPFRMFNKDGSINTNIEQDIFGTSNSTTFVIQRNQFK